MTRHGIWAEVDEDEALGLSYRSPHLDLVKGDFTAADLVLATPLRPPIRCLCGWSADKPEQPQARNIAKVYGLVPGLLLEALIHLDSVLPEELS